MFIPTWIIVAILIVVFAPVLLVIAKVLFAFIPIILDPSSYMTPRKKRKEEDME